MRFDAGLFGGYDYSMFCLRSSITQGRRHLRLLPCFLRLNLLRCRLGFHLKFKIVAEEQGGVR